MLYLNFAHTQDHVLRRLLHPFTFRSVYVNNRALESLVPENSLIHHASGFELDFPGLDKLEYRTGFRPLGCEGARSFGIRTQTHTHTHTRCKVSLGKDQKVQRIFDYHEQKEHAVGDEGWAQAKAHTHTYTHKHKHKHKHRHRHRHRHTDTHTNTHTRKGAYGPTRPRRLCSERRLALGTPFATT